MLNHLTFGVADLTRSTAFYDDAFAPLGMRRLHTGRDGNVAVAAYGDTRPWFWIVEQDPTRGKFHIALTAPDRATVDAFHAAALAAGGRDNGAPGLRQQYHAMYYAAFVLDPDGHNIETVCGNG